MDRHPISSTSCYSTNCINFFTHLFSRCTVRTSPMDAPFLLRPRSQKSRCRCDAERRPEERETEGRWSESEGNNPERGCRRRRRGGKKSEQLLRLRIRGGLQRGRGTGDGIIPSSPYAGSARKWHTGTRFYVHIHLIDFFSNTVILALTSTYALSHHGPCIRNPVYHTALG